MATPTCPKTGCGSTTFAVQPIAAAGSARLVPVICCYSCGTVVGVGADDALADRLDRLEKKLSAVYREVR